MSDFYFICEHCGSQDGYLQNETSSLTDTTTFHLIACGFCNHLQWQESSSKNPSIH